MGLTTAEIRDRAERFRAAVLEEIHDARAGRKAWPELAPLYETQAVLQPARTLPVIERAMASAEEDDERQLRKLLRWAARHHLEAHNARLDDEFAYWRATSKVEADGVAVPVSQGGNNSLVMVMKIGMAPPPQSPMSKNTGRKTEPGTESPRK